MKNDFREALLKKIRENMEILQDSKGNWRIKGFISSNNELFTISQDTKVLSKVLEIQIFPLLIEFAAEENLTVELANTQNQYPDVTFIDNETKDKYALDLKSTFVNEKDKSYCKGFTLGAYSGYFRDRTSKKNTHYPYGEYLKHFVLGIIYERNVANEREKYVLSKTKLDEIPSVIKNFKILVQEKYKLASRVSGSGNTKNIGSVTRISDLVNGNGMFTSVEDFDKYWMTYESKKVKKGNK